MHSGWNSSLLGYGRCSFIFVYRWHNPSACATLIVHNQCNRKALIYVRNNLWDHWFAHVLEESPQPHCKHSSSRKTIVDYNSSPHLLLLLQMLRQSMMNYQARHWRRLSWFSLVDVAWVPHIVSVMANTTNIQYVSHREFHKEWWCLLPSTQHSHWKLFNVANFGCCDLNERGQLWFILCGPKIDICSGGTFPFMMSDVFWSRNWVRVSMTLVRESDRSFPLRLANKLVKNEGAVEQWRNTFPSTSLKPEAGMFTDFLKSPPDIL